MKEDELIQSLKSMSVSPDPKWEADFLTKFAGKEKINVTVYGKLRTNIYNFLSYFKMYKNLKIAGAVAASILVVGTASVVTVYAAQGSKPGDFLFGLEKALENVERNTKTDNTSRAEFELERLIERKVEFNALKQEKKDTKEAEKEIKEQEKNVKNAANDSAKIKDSVKKEIEDEIGDDDGDDVTPTGVTPTVKPTEVENEDGQDDNKQEEPKSKPAQTVKPTEKQESEGKGGSSDDGGSRDD